MDNLILEPNGSVSMDFFTVLNDSNNNSLTDEQTFNVTTFSSLRQWIFSMYRNNPPPNPSSLPNSSPQSSSLSEQLRKSLGGELKSEDEEETSINRVGNGRISPSFQEAVINYCSRILDQSTIGQNVERGGVISGGGSLKNVATSVTNQGEKGENKRGFTEICSIEAIRILDNICEEDPSSVSRIIPSIKKIFARISNVSSKSSGEKKGKTGGVYRAKVMLAVVEFFTKHGDAVVHDAEPAIKFFLEDSINRFCNSFSFSFSFSFLLSVLII